MPANEADMTYCMGFSDAQSLEATAIFWPFQVSALTLNQFHMSKKKKNPFRLTEKHLEFIEICETSSEG